jgi:hypothetical protein
MLSAEGEGLAPEGNTIRLSGAADDLADVYLFPNPYRAGSGRGGIMIAGLPASASIEVFSADGVLVRKLDESDGDGGRLWDVRDNTGSPVPSGVYLVLVKSDGAAPVLKKAAVIQ